MRNSERDCVWERRLLFVVLSYLFWFQCPQLDRVFVFPTLLFLPLLSLLFLQHNALSSFAFACCLCVCVRVLVFLHNLFLLPCFCFCEGEGDLHVCFFCSLWSFFPNPDKASNRWKGQGRMEKKINKNTDEWRQDPLHLFLLLSLLVCWSVFFLFVPHCSSLTWIGVSWTGVCVCCYA